MGQEASGPGPAARDRSPYDRVVTHYEVLGVEPDAPVTEIRRAYLDLARRNHPDVVDGSRRAEAEARMRDLTAAWAVLGDARRRSRYDDELDAARRAAQGDRSVRRTPFVPYEDDDDPPDERFDAVRIGDDLTDESLGTGVRPPRLLQVLPAGLLLLAIGALSAGLAASFGPLLALGAVALVGSMLTFVAAPVWTIFASRNSERE